MTKKEGDGNVHGVGSAMCSGKWPGMMGELELQFRLDSEGHRERAEVLKQEAGMIRSASSIVQQQWGKWSREAETGGRRSQLGGSKQDKFQPRPGRRQCRSPSRKG